MIEPSAPKPLQSTRVRVVAAIVVAVAIAFVVWLVARPGDSKSTSSASTHPVAASVSNLGSVAGSLKHQLYWVGQKSGFTYELTKGKSGNVWVRYLPSGTQIGDTRANFLTVGTYPEKNAFQNVQAVQLPTLLPGLLVSEADPAETERIIRETGLLPDGDRKFFSVLGSNFTGYVVAGVVVSCEDSGEYDEPSQVWPDGPGHLS